MSACGEEVVLHGKDKDFSVKEYWDIREIWLDLLNKGEYEKASDVFKQMPVDADFLMAMKKMGGKEEVLSHGWDLTEANSKFGEGWLDK